MTLNTFQNRNNGQNNWDASKSVHQPIISGIPKFLFLNGFKMMALLLLLPWASPLGKPFPSTLKCAKDYGNRPMSWVLALFLTFWGRLCSAVDLKYFIRVIYLLVLISWDAHFILKWFSYKLQHHPLWLVIKMKDNIKCLL